MVEGVFSWVDLIMGPMYLIILYGLAYGISKYKYTDLQLRKHFMWGFTAKVIGCLGFIAVYALYYGSGDTFAYFHDVQRVFNILQENPWKVSRVLSVTELDHFTQIYLDPSTAFGHGTSKEGYTVIKLAIIFGFFTFNSYLATSLCFAFASFLGVWGLYRTVSYIFPKYYTYVAIPILYFPSVFFWGSSIMKDSIVIGFLGLLTYSAYKIFFKKDKIIIYCFIAIICFYFLSLVKEYVIIAYLPAMLFWLFVGPVSQLSLKYKIVLFPVSIILFGIIVYSLIPVLESITTRYTIENILKTAETTAAYIYRISTEQGGSAYSLGEISYTPVGLIKVFPKAVIVTLYRPYLFEANNPVMLISALEGTAIIASTAFVIIKVGIFNFFKILFSNPFLLLCFVFSIIFAFAVGVSTFNFGSLVRYKIPCLPFYGIALIIPYFIHKTKSLSNS